MYLDVVERVVHDVVAANHLFGQCHVGVHKRVHRIVHHALCRLRHHHDARANFRDLAREVRRDLGNIRRSIANALDVGDHFQRGGNGAQITRHRLLTQQQGQAAALNFALHVVHFAVALHHRRGKRKVVALKGPHRIVDGFHGKRAHFDQACHQLFQFCVKRLSDRHYFHPYFLLLYPVRRQRQTAFYRLPSGLSRRCGISQNGR
ncbi:hypothetical protein SDC9_157513 [bioreactor metagenome]|uniref:Uncharacterized protein n=1 Tax=bioreactor metagenome TaxID=1076179 RepID=A0A645F769_9ZZZZ